MEDKVHERHHKTILYGHTQVTPHTNENGIKESQIVRVADGSLSEIEQ